MEALVSKAKLHLPIAQPLESWGTLPGFSEGRPAPLGLGEMPLCAHQGTIPPYLAQKTPYLWARKPHPSPEQCLLPALKSATCLVLEKPLLVSRKHFLPRGTPPSTTLTPGDTPPLALKKAWGTFHSCLQKTFGLCLCNTLSDKCRKKHFIKLKSCACLWQMLNKRVWNEGVVLGGLH